MYSRVYVEITNICNMRCSFCHGHSRKLQQMTKEEFSQVLDRLEGHTEYIYYHLMGEPLTHPELPLFLKLAAQKGFRSVITTNGTLLDKRGDELIHSGLHKVNISIHSFEGSDEQAHFDYLQKVADFAAKASAAGIITCLRLWNRGCDGGNNDRAVAFLQQCLPGDWKENSRGFRLRDRLFLEWDVRFTWPDRDAPELGKDVFCYGLKDHFGILCDGTVVPCCLDSDGIIALGNIYSQTGAEILGSERATAMAKGFSCSKATEALCRGCGYARRFR